tara:strand:+ start:309 stop:479 length:171 start_codon:yes stop_codon:yes gene_type:complete
MYFFKKLSIRRETPKYAFGLPIVLMPIYEHENSPQTPKTQNGLSKLLPKKTIKILI